MTQEELTEDMREYKCTDLSGEAVDLDDAKTYKHLPKDRETLRNRFFKQIGYSYLYMEFWHRESYYPDTSKQRQRINKLASRFTNEEKVNYENTLWYQEMVFLLEDENENMC